jgi:hypothetical protein
MRKDRVPEINGGPQNTVRRQLGSSRNHFIVHITIFADRPKSTLGTR